MKYSLAAFTFSILAGCANPPRHGKPEPIGFATETNATLIAVVSCEHQLFPTPEPYSFYFKPDNEPNVGYLGGSMSSFLHGVESDGGNFSAGIGFTPTLEKGRFGLNFTSHYFSYTKNVTDSFSISTPIGKDLNGTKGLMKYKIEWKELKRNEK